MTETTPIKGPHEKFCTECGSIINLKAEICPKCGVRQMYNPTQRNIGDNAPNGKNRIVAALLAFFLGWFGAHKFYLGRIGWGIFYMLLFWTGLPAILAFIDFIILLCIPDKIFNEEYGQR